MRKNNYMFGGKIMAKTAFEKALEKKQREDAKNVKKRIDAENKRQQEEARATRAASIVNGQPMVGNIRSLDKTAEVIVEQICLGYDKENKYTLSNNSVQIPKYISDLRLEFEKLKQYGMISDYNVWTPDCWKIDILPCLLTYKDDKEKGILEENKKQTKQISIGTINAANGNVVIGDVINSSINVDNSIQRIQKMIEEKGDEDKEELLLLLDEFKEILENIEDSRHIPKNKGFMNRLSSHLSKHGWFYAEIVSLLGSVGIKLLMG